LQYYSEDEPILVVYQMNNILSIIIGSLTEKLQTFVQNQAKNENSEEILYFCKISICICRLLRVKKYLQITYSLNDQ